MRSVRTEDRPVAARCAPPSVEANMRRLRAFVAVADCRSVNRAAERLHLTQSAVTRAIRGLETQVGLTLFERSPRGMATTEYGDILVQRARRAFDHLETAERQLVALQPCVHSRRRATGVAARLAQRHLQTLSAIADCQTESAAARELGVSQPAVTLALRDVEQMVDAPLFLRTPRGMIATPGGEVLVRGAKLALHEIEAAGDDVAAHLGLVRGRLVVGALPLSGTAIAPLAVSRVAGQYPQLRLSVVEAPYDTLVRGLCCGEIDAIVGALHPRLPPDIAHERLFDDELSVVARPGHPLAQRRHLTLDDLAGAQWVLPFRRTAHRNVVERAMLAAGLSIPDDAIEANTVGMVRRLLVDSDRLSVLSRLQVDGVRQDGLLSVLPLELSGPGLAIGIMTRADAMRTVGLETLRAQLRRLHRGAPVDGPVRLHAVA